MARPVRLLLCSTLAAGVALAAARALPRLGVAGLPGTVTPADPRVRYLDHLALEKRAIGRDLAEGRATLWEAAARTRDLARRVRWPSDTGPPPVGPDEPGATEAERYCRAALLSARVFCDSYPAGREGVEFWESELEARLAEGPIVLPERTPE
jgi:hypothetical protein